MTPYPNYITKILLTNHQKPKKGSARNISQDVSPKTYTLPNYKSPNNSITLRIVSWNLNMNANSAYAPPNWSKNNDKFKLIYQQTNAQNPDIITFQEVSRPLLYQNLTKINDDNVKNNLNPLIKMYIDSKKWIYTHTKSSHCGYTIILVNKKLIDNEIEVEFNEYKPDSNGKFVGVVLYKTVKLCIVCVNICEYL